jgi:hypothetical protein
MSGEITATQMYEMAVHIPPSWKALVWVAWRQKVALSLDFRTLFVCTTYTPCSCSRTLLC